MIRKKEQNPFTFGKGMDTHPTDTVRLRRSAGHVDREVWKRYLQTGVADPRLDSVLLDSWQRCVALGVDPAKDQPVFFPGGNEAEQDIIIDLADRLESSLMPFARENGLMYTITDAGGCLMNSGGSAKALRRAERLRFGPGADWSELSVGTNAIGTALAVGFPVQIFGTEHFCVGHQEWRCTAAPFFAPSGRQVGCVDLSSHIDGDHSRALEMVLGVARMFERILLQTYAGEMESWPAALLANPLLGGQGGVVVAQAEGHICGTDTKADAMLSHRFRTLTGQHVDDVFDMGPFYRAIRERKTGEQPVIAVQTVFSPALAGSARPLWSPAGFWLGILIQLAEPEIRAGSIAKGTRALLDRAGPPHEHAPSSWTFLGRSRHAVQIRRQIAAFAQTPSTVLVTGESGTGKELVAKGLHASGPRRNAPFVAVNCGGFAAELIQSELFGYAAGAFTGADRGGRTGVFEQADSGVLFLDEIGELPLRLQANLLRVLEDRRVTRVGGNKPVPVNVKVVAATNRNLAVEVEAGRFREDLFHRLCVTSIAIPPLRERPEDIADIAVTKFSHLCAELGLPPLEIDTATIRFLEGLSWPGNARSLVNALEYACNRYFLEPFSVLRKEHLAHDLNRAPSTPAINLVKAEETTIRHALQLHKNNISRTAKALGIGRNTLYAKMRRLGIA